MLPLVYTKERLIEDYPQYRDQNQKGDVNGFSGYDMKSGYYGKQKEFYNMISDTAKYGGITRGNKLFDNSMKKTLSSILNDIKSGQFKDEFENKNNEISFPDSFKILEEKTKEILSKINKK